MTTKEMAIIVAAITGESLPECKARVERLGFAYKLEFGKGKRQVTPSESSEWVDAAWKVLFWWNRKGAAVAKQKLAKLDLRHRARVEDAAILQGMIYERMGTEQQYRPHPSTWLNQQRWMDGAEHAKELWRIYQSEVGYYVDLVRPWVDRTCKECGLSLTDEQKDEIKMEMIGKLKEQPANPEGRWTGSSLIRLLGV